MDTIPIVRANLLSPIAGFLKQAGASLEPGLRQARLPILLFDEPNEFIAAHRAYVFVDTMARREGIEHLGLLAGSFAGVDAFGNMEPVLARSPTLYHALVSLCRLSYLEQSHGHIRLAWTDDEIWVNGGISVGVETPGYQHVELYVVAVLTAIVQSFTGLRWRPPRVTLTTDGLPDCADTDLLGDSAICVRQRAVGIAVPRSLLSLPPRVGRRFQQRSDQYESAQSNPKPLPRDFAGSLKEVLTPYLRVEYPGIELPSELAGTSTRTLQRRLAEVGLTFKELMDQTRYEAAVPMLEDVDIKLIEIAYELGYSEPAHFTRAFRRWAGVSPREFRRQSCMA